MEGISENLILGLKYYMIVGLLFYISFSVIAHSLHSLPFPTSCPPHWGLCHHTELSR